ncbi:putative peptidase YuxL [Hypsizygus marmoreus]|uniref:Peptidase YuxL n=1 Tax=Hypsizygus marmoreus TaxID=39966 RepID=A0A369J997_HYPMA|nr:putative peptidase YuxL [Hypsizygus marmoreus]
MITPQDVASSDGITDLRLSRDGSRVVYTSGPLYKTGNNRTSALWLAETTIENSARKITTGDSHDYAPSFHPKASQIFFLSDRHEVGGAIQLYTLSFDATSFTEANRITHSRYPVLSYSISPDGNFVAFTLKSSSSEQNDKEPISVWRENLGFDALHFIDLRDSSKT